MKSDAMDNITARKPKRQKSAQTDLSYPTYLGKGIVLFYQLVLLKLSWSNYEGIKAYTVSRAKEMLRSFQRRQQHNKEI